MIVPGTVGRESTLRSSRVIIGRSTPLIVGLAAIATGLVSLRTSQASSGLSYLTDSPLTVVLGLSAGWGLVAVGLETVRRGRRSQFGYLLAISGIAWFLPEWSDPAIGAPFAFTLGLSFLWLYPAIVGHALSAAAGSTNQVSLRRIMPIGYALFVVGLGIVPALGFDPRAAGCGFCPANLIAAGGSPALLDAATRVATALAVAWSAAAALILLSSLRSSGALSREFEAPILIPGIAFFALVAIALERTIQGAVPTTDPTDRLLRLGQAIALVAVAVGVASEWVRARQSRIGVARVVADLAGSPPIGGLRDHLARILGDPQLQLAYPVGGAMLVDARGRPVDTGPRPGRTTTPIVRDGSVVAVLEHEANLLRDPSDVEEVVAVTRLGLEHERLQADARAQLDALQAARRRIVEAGDARRMQLERDLHDGAQQHLIALSIGLRFVERGTGIEALMNEAAAELRLAMDDLREVAHGIYPTVLGDEGFAAAIDALGEASTVPVTIVAMVEERFDARIEVAAYHVVADVVRGGVGPFRVRAMQGRAALTIEIEGAEIPEQIQEDLTDRVGAVEGSVSVVRADVVRPILTAAIPLGSEVPS